VQKKRRKKEEKDRHERAVKRTQITRNITLFHVRNRRNFRSLKEIGVD